MDTSSSSSSSSSSMVLQVERTSSIEREPRTLNVCQINFAREAAMYVMNTRSVEEAMRIFTEGLEPVVRCGRDNERMGGINSGEPEQLLGCRSSNSPLYNISDQRDIASAPF